MARFANFLLIFTALVAYGGLCGKFKFHLIIADFVTWICHLGLEVAK